MYFTKDEQLSRMKELIEKLNYYTSLYDKGIMEISDYEWDRMYFELQLLENSLKIYLPESPTQKIYYNLVTGLTKKKHSYPMLSLGKTKDWDEFLRYFNYYSVVGMIKADGLTCTLTYEDGKLISAVTRGNGEIGEDVTHNAMVIKSIPKKIDHKGLLTVAGEIVCLKKDFAEFADEYANPRNFAAGSIRLLDSRECEKRNLTFLLWNVLEGMESNSFMARLETAWKLGFTVVPWTSSFDWDAKEFLIEKAEEAGIPIDGLVGRFNDIAYGDSLGRTEHHFNNAFAFKFADEEYESELLDIEYTLGRTGVLTPVAIFKDIDTGDSIVNRANLHNLSVMRELLGLPYVGQKVTVIKSNEIIPQIIRASRTKNDYVPIRIPSVCPICGAPTEEITEVDSTMLYCAGADCPGKLITKVDYYASKKGLDIKGLSRATLEKLIDLGWINNISDIYDLKNHRSEWILQPGFGQKSVDNILNAIETSRKPKLEKFICALGIPMIGTTLSKELVKVFKTYEEFRDAAKNKYDFSIIDKIAYEKCAAIWGYDFTEADKLAACMLGFEVDEAPAADLNLSDFKIAVTGSLKLHKNREELQAKIEQKGGKLSTAVSKNTTLLINNDAASASAKNVAARKLGIPILTEQEFIEQYLEK